MNSKIDSILKKIDLKIDKIFNNIKTPITNRTQKEKLHKMVKKLDNYLHPKIMEAYYKLGDPSLSVEDKKLLTLLKDELKAKSELINDKYFVSTHIPVLSSDRIKLYEGSDPYVEFRYNIFSSTSGEYIGNITYDDDQEYVSSFGNIGYEIVPKHRGHNYALEALILLTDKLHKEGITEVIIYVRKDNIASIKIAQKFGGKQIASENDNVLVFKCDLNIKRKVILSNHP